ncbi:SKIP5 [Scenedesmus sp. PABB004]|nr:SKIP5 [Scenedesmus sp. PABB004]
MAAATPTARSTTPRLGDLDDACLLRIFKALDPLPELFRVAQTCWRFRRLVSDKRAWLVVAPERISPEQTPSGRVGPTFTSLRAAVAASRPGDTIWLAPGMAHDAAAVELRWPLHLLGGGREPEDTALTAPAGADSALDVRASCKITMVSLSSRRAPCIIHRRGLLTVERCRVAADPCGLPHLVSPVLTLAASGTAPARGGGGAGGGGGPAAPQPLPRLALASAGGGRLVVAETRLEGGASAVACGGTGRLRDVRVIQDRRAALFWLSVDSSDPGGGAAALPQGLLLPGGAPPPAPRPGVDAQKLCEWGRSRLGGGQGALPALAAAGVSPAALAAHLAARQLRGA